MLRYEWVRKGFLSREKVRVAKRIGSIGYRDEGTVVALKDIKRVRQLCQLREEDGVPSDTFYESAAVVDAFVNRYRTVLRRLGRR